MPQRAKKTWSEHFIKTYGVPPPGGGATRFERTSLVQHKGKLIAFAMDDQRTIWYSVLDLKPGASPDAGGSTVEEGKGALDVDYWMKGPALLRFPKEISRVGYQIAGQFELPVDAKDQSIKEKNWTPKQWLRATTARFTAPVPFQVLSDGKHVYVFRQAIGSDDTDHQLCITSDGDLSPVSSLAENDTKLFVVDRTLLVDRFVLAGNQLMNVMEARFRRSRNKNRPASRKDSMGYKDMDEKAFYEPTQELAVVKQLEGGCFSVLLLPSGIPGTQRWQIFAYNRASAMIDAFNIERDEEGLFNTQGIPYYTCPVHHDILTTKSGNCPRVHHEEDGEETVQPLIPKLSTRGYAEWTLKLGTNDYVELEDGPVAAFEAADGITIEAWVYSQEGESSSTLSFEGDGASATFTCKDTETTFSMVRDGSTQTLTSRALCRFGHWVHLAISITTWGTGRLYMDGLLIAEGTIELPQPQPFPFTKFSFSGKLDELRVWNRSRAVGELQEQKNHRLIGNEPGLMGYWCLDEGRGSRLHDQTDHGWDAQIKGTVTWTYSDAPIGDHPGVRRSHFQLGGLPAVGGLSAVFYHQQESSTSGYSGEDKPMKRQARVMLACAVADSPGKDEHKLAVVDFGISRLGRLAQVPDSISLGDSQQITNLSEAQREAFKLMATIGEVETDLWRLREYAVTLLGYFELGATFYWLGDYEDGDASNEGPHPFSWGEQNRINERATSNGIEWEHWNDKIRAMKIDPGMEFVAYEDEDFAKYLGTYSEDVRDFHPLHDGLKITGVRVQPGRGLRSEVDAEFEALKGLLRKTGKALNEISEPFPPVFVPFSGQPSGQEPTLDEVILGLSLSVENIPVVKARLKSLKYFIDSKLPELAQMKEQGFAGGQEGLEEAYNNLTRSPGFGPLELLHLDPDGLTVMGGILPEITTRSAPNLCESATGQLALYFRNNYDFFTYLHYDASTGRAVYEVPARSGHLQFVARSGGQYVDNVAISVTEVSELQDFCDLTITAREFSGDTTIVETWNHLPRDCARMALALNGEGIDYDYRTHAQVVGRRDIDLSTGSLLFRVISSNATGDVANIDVENKSDPTPTRTARWETRSLGQALEVEQFYQPAQGVPLSRFKASGDLTLEAWVKPVPKKGYHKSPILHYRNGDARYSLGLEWTDDSRYRIFAQVNNKRVTTVVSSFPPNHFSHFAAVYQQPYGLQFNGDDFLDCGKDGLDLTGSLTIEVAFKVQKLGTRQYLIRKGDDEKRPGESLPYALCIEPDGTLSYYHESYYLNAHGFLSSIALYVAGPIVETGKYYRFVVQRQIDSLEVEKEEDGQTKLDSENQPILKRECRIQIYQEGVIKIDRTTDLQRNPLKTPKGSSTGLTIGKQFDGTIGEVTIWSSGHTPNPDTGRVEDSGPVSRWLFTENEGEIAQDSVGSNHARFEGAPRWVYDDPAAGSLVIYQNGIAQSEDAQGDMVSSELQRLRSHFFGGDPEINSAFQNEILGSSIRGQDPFRRRDDLDQFHLGGLALEGASLDFEGQLEEVRIWKTTRTHEQVLDNMHRRLLGENQDLIAYYPFDGSGPTVVDRSGNGCALAPGLEKPTKFVLSTAPVGRETPQSQNALLGGLGIRMQHQRRIDDAPAMQEYGDLQYNKEGLLFGVHKRCYSYLENGQWKLETGFKVGNLITEWVSQAQYAPQLIGYIEGAPPVPGENLTSTGLVLGEASDYDGASSIELTEAENVTKVHSTSEDAAFEAAVSTKVAKLIGGETAIGVGVTTKVGDFHSKVGLQASLEISDGWLEESSVSMGRNTTESTRLGLKGVWEHGDSDYSHKDALGRAFAVGRRFVPDNTGLALVKSFTADIFALRLESTNALVAYRMLPSPDIPKDWNLISFPINPRYTKQGALDGRIGYHQDGSVQCDADFPLAAGYGEHSYFRPREAYALKKRIERKAQSQANRYSGWEPLDLVNTYVWTADGGFFAETQESLTAKLETSGEFFNQQYMGGGYMELNSIIGGVGFGFELDAMFGRSINEVTTTSTESENEFGVEVEANVDNDLQVYFNDTDRVYLEEQGLPYEEDASGAIKSFVQNGTTYTVSTGGAVFKHEDGTAKPAQPALRPGKVDAYRFMTFYCQPRVEHFEDFRTRVVDQKWLAESDSANAYALRQAVSESSDDSKSVPWRVMHRVTFVSRVLPEVSSSSAHPVATKLKTANINSNWELLQRIEPYVLDLVTDWIAFRDAIRQTIDLHLPTLASVKEEIADYLCLIHGVEDPGESRLPPPDLAFYGMHEAPRLEGNSIRDLDELKAPKGDSTHAFSADGNQYIYYCYPYAWGRLNEIFDEGDEGESVLSTFQSRISRVTVQDSIVRFFVYRSKNAVSKGSSARFKFAF